MPSRKVRGLALLATLSATLVLAVLAAFSVVVWWIPLIALAATIASFFWLRSAVQAEIRVRRAARARVRRSRSAGARTASGAVPAPHRVAAEEHEVATPFSGHELVEDATVIATAQAADESEAVDTVPAEVTAEGRPDGWQPVPVPPPTYTLKAKAERPTPVFAEDDDIPQAPQFEGVSARDTADTDRKRAYGT